MIKMKYRATIKVERTPTNLINCGRDMDENDCIRESFKANKNSTIESATKHIKHSLSLSGITKYEILNIVKCAE